MLKATIDKNKKTCHMKTNGSSLELANDLCLLIMNFMKILMIKHSKDDALEIVIEACTSGIANALEESE